MRGRGRRRLASAFSVVAVAGSLGAGACTGGDDRRGSEAGAPSPASVGPPSTIFDPDRIADPDVVAHFAPGLGDQELADFQSRLIADIGPRDDGGIRQVVIDYPGRRLQILLRADVTEQARGRLRAYLEGSPVISRVEFR